MYRFSGADTCDTLMPLVAEMSVNEMAGRCASAVAERTVRQANAHHMPWDFIILLVRFSGPNAFEPDDTSALKNGV
jgi:hypothetical protein